MRRAAAASWAFPVLSGALMSVGVVASASTPDDKGVGSGFLIATLAFAVPVAVFAVVGALITSRQHGNVVGWLLTAVGLLFSVVVASSSVALWALTTGSLDRQLAVWIDVGGNCWVIALGLIGTQLLLRLPDGRLPSPRWRWYSRTTIVLIGVALVGMATQTTPVEGVRGAENPLASSTLSSLSFAFLFVIIGFVISIVALVRRYRRASGHDRAQLRWIAFSGVVFVVVYVISLVALGFVDDHSAAGNIATSTAQTAFAALPIGIGFSVLRRNLYDIDVVINRALVYAALTATLAGVYLGSILLMQLALNTFTAGSGLAVAASTLATAALVRPARARIQEIVDRRFFRHKYDATRTLERFGAHLRSEVDLNALTDELRAVVAETMQPAHLTIWVRPTERVR
ncbi:MAG: hypothetical protein ACJ716_12840 [Marmoricola sp.]